MRWRVKAVALSGVLAAACVIGCGAKGAERGPSPTESRGSPAVGAETTALVRKPLDELRADVKKADMKGLEGMSRAHSDAIATVGKRLKEILGDSPKGAAVRDADVQSETMELTRTLSALAEREKIIVDELIRKGRESFGKDVR